MFVFRRKNDIYSGKASGVRQFSLNKMIHRIHPITTGALIVQQHTQNYINGQSVFLWRFACIFVIIYQNLKFQTKNLNQLIVCRYDWTVFLKSPCHDGYKKACIAHFRSYQSRHHEGISFVRRFRDWMRDNDREMSRGSLDVHLHGVGGRTVR